MHPYNPQPLDTSGVELPADLLELTELLARNTHDVWAAQRLAEGWQYGAERNDKRKEHPCLVPYEDLPENEKEYDRNTAMEILKVIKKSGFKI
ncbi:MAG: RyR domain-containing protein [Bacteroidales bacterium]|nr:RyR domain-containing protein [Bacteroidales bacterium]